MTLYRFRDTPHMDDVGAETDDASRAPRFRRRPQRSIAARMNFLVSSKTSQTPDISPNPGKWPIFNSATGVSAEIVSAEP